MKHILVLIVMMGAMQIGIAEPYNDEIIAAIAKTSGKTKAEVMASFETGCDSGITRYMVECSWNHATAADIMLDTVYQQLLKKLRGTRGKQELPKAQRAWRAFQSAHCAFDASSWDRVSYYGLAVAECQTKMAKLRTKELEEFLRCDQNNCPGSD